MEPATPQDTNPDQSDNPIREAEPVSNMAGDVSRSERQPHRKYLANGADGPSELNDPICEFGVLSQKFPLTFWRHGRHQRSGFLLP